MKDNNQFDDFCSIIQQLTSKIKYTILILLFVVMFTMFRPIFTVLVIFLFFNIVKNVFL